MHVTTESAVAVAEFPEATRSLTSILAPLERRTLIWLATRMPRRINSDHLTALALTAMLTAGLSYWLASVTPIGLLLATTCLAINWFGDSLDGTLARVRDRQRPRYGFYVDHVVDAFGALFLLGGLGLSGYMSPLVALGLLVKTSHFKVGPTELRILLAVGSLTLLLHPRASLFGHQYRLFDVGGVVAIIGLFITLIIAASINTRALYLAETKPRGAAAR